MFSTARYAAEPCELMRGCSLADNFTTEYISGKGVLGSKSGAGSYSYDHGVTLATGRYIEYYNVIAQPGNFSVTIQFSAPAANSGGYLIASADLIPGVAADGFAIWVDSTGIRANYSDGVSIPTRCSKDIEYWDADATTIHTVTYTVDKVAAEQKLYVDSLTRDPQTASVSGSTGSANKITVGEDFKGTIYKFRVFNAYLTEDEHDTYYIEGSPSYFWDNPTAAYKCDSWNDDTDGHYIWDKSGNLNDLTQGDGSTSSTFPVMNDTDGYYAFDLIDDYIDDWPTLAANYTFNAALSTPQEPYPYITQDNDTTTMDLLDTTGAYWGNLHNLSIYPEALNQLQLYHAQYQHMYWLTRNRATDMYHRLITEGTCKLALFMDGDRGVYTNLAPVGGCGLATLVTRGDPVTDGCAFGSATSNLTFKHNAEYNSNEITLAFYGPFGSNLVSTLIEKSNDYDVVVDVVNLNFASSVLAHTLSDNQHIAVTGVNGCKPIFYVDGEYVGVGDANITLTNNTADVVVGNNATHNKVCQYDLKQVYMGDKALSALEIKALYQSAQIIGATPMETGARRKARRAPATGAVDETVDPGDNFQLIAVEVIFNTAPTTSEDFTIVAVNGSGDENPLYTVDPSSPSTTSIRFQPGQGQCRHIDNTTIDINYTNTDGRIITVNTTYQLDESVTA